MVRMKANMDKMAEEDPDIYSTNHSIHITRVIKGGYAYVGDTTAFEVEMSETCDIDMIRETLAPYEYSVAVWDNSAYLPVVYDE
jgi:hypothetical protein